MIKITTMAQKAAIRPIWYAGEPSSSLFKTSLFSTFFELTFLTLGILDEVNTLITEKAWSRPHNQGNLSCYRFPTPSLHSRNHLECCYSTHRLHWHHSNCSVYHIKGRRSCYQIGAVQTVGNAASFAYYYLIILIHFTNQWLEI